MCWSLEVSIITGLVSYAIALYLWIRNNGPDRWLAITLFSFSTIQWTDAILWYDEAKNKLNSASCLNKTITQYIIPFILAMGCLANLYGAHYTGHEISNQVMLIFILLSMGCLIWMHKRSTYTTLSTEQNLKWTPSNSLFGSLVFFAIFIYPFLRYYENSTSQVLFISFAFILFMYSFTKDTFGSNWCLLANMLSLVALFRPYIDKK